MSAFDRMKKMKDEIEARGLEEADTYKQKLAAARAEVAFKQSVIEEDNRGITNLRAELRTAQAEIAALRRVLAEVLASASPNPANHPAMSRAWASAESALFAPSAAEPLLADIRAAVEAMGSKIAYHATACALAPDGSECDCWISKHAAALTALRRWVP